MNTKWKIVDKNPIGILVWNNYGLTPMDKKWYPVNGQIHTAMMPANNIVRYISNNIMRQFYEQSMEQNITIYLG